MNKIIFSVLLLSSSLAFADEEQLRPCTEEYPNDQARIATCQQERGRAADSRNGNGNGNGNNNSGNRNGNEVGNQCQRVYSSAGTAIRTVGTAGATGPVKYFSSAQGPGMDIVVPPPGAAAVAVAVTPNPLELPAISADKNASLKICKGYEAISVRLGSSIGAAAENRRAQDGTITCVRKAGITADWDSCTSALGMYNNIKMAEAAMQIFQGVQTNSVQNRAQNDFAQRQAAGDGQNAAYDAQTATMNSSKALNEQQAMAYAAAVAALYSKIQSWIKESPEAFTQKGCGGAPAAAPVRTPPAATPVTPELFASVEATPRPAPASADCAAAARQGYQEYQGFVFANKDAKGQFTAAAMLFAGKAIAAGIKANQLGAIAQKIQEAKKTTEDPYNPATFDLCQVNMADPKCAQAGTRTNGSGLQDGGFSFGDGFGNNAFTPIGSAEDMANVDPGALPGDQVIGDTTNPFVDDAKKASGILDPAGAASTQAAASGGSGSGGGAGAGGGGSASLGNDTPGADDSKKENDIKANKADGKYGQFAGGGFQAIKPLKDDNPFANLFDGKGGGSLQEDRSIASGDIDGRDSGIFSKISKRYGQVQADKRIEAKNLEE